MFYQRQREGSYVQHLLYYRRHRRCAFHSWLSRPPIGEVRGPFSQCALVDPAKPIGAQLDKEEVRSCVFVRIFSGLCV